MKVVSAPQQDWLDWGLSIQCERVIGCTISKGEIDQGILEGLPNDNRKSKSFNKILLI